MEGDHTRKVILTKAHLWKLFKRAFLVHAGRHFIETPDSLANIAPLIEYFVSDPSFFTRKHLIRSIDGQLLHPSFDKGLLIVGGYGNGKTTIMQAFELLFSYYQMPMRFKGYTTHDLVTWYERIGSDLTYRESSKYQFYHCLTTVLGLYLDDVKKEREASNYGKVNLIREVLEKRYNQKKLKTYLTCNYREGDTTEDVEDALTEFGEKYGGHIYDRLFEMFNIIEFKGASFRR
ncbi:P-loop NTPase family protein [Aquimarina sediminis]|uniref:hypothetical protein n=1 Tax=Aquimarina sediminis TaxID=2070536 RepID=UPI000CA05C6C|nr:hypothetical protein [Aquimarina sediminis]